MYSDILRVPYNSRHDTYENNRQKDGTMTMLTCTEGARAAVSGLTGALETTDGICANGIHIAGMDIFSALVSI